MSRILLDTYGCTLNGADSDIMQAALEREGHSVYRGDANIAGSYDYVIINTCTVKKPTEQKILSRIDKARHMGKKLIVAGCMVGANREKVLRHAPDASILNTGNVGNVSEVIASISAGRDANAVTRVLPDKAGLLVAGGGTVARIPISEGCLSNCSFCETKFARGPLHSFDHAVIVRAVGRAVEAGAREIELTSQDVGAYGRDTGTDIAELASAVCDIDGDFKVRIGMLNPEHLPRYMDRLIDAFGRGKLYRFVHLPVQSGSDAVLRSMRRRYSVSEYSAMVREFQSRIDDISVATDMIVGYPTETETDFVRSVELIEELGFSRTNISRFGAMDHTDAARLPKLDDRLVKERAARMHRIARMHEINALAKIMGKRVRVLATEINHGSLLGRDDAYRQIAIEGENVQPGQILNAEVYASSPVCLIARA